MTSLEEKQEKLITIARSWLDTPWRHTGNQKGIAVDCINFLFEVGKEYGLDCTEIPRRYTRISVYNEIEKYFNENFQKCDKNDRQPADLLLFSFSGYRTHVGIMTGKETFIHASLIKNKVVEHALDGQWQHKLQGVWRIFIDG